jgi:glucosyl-dolichyl phosphate glucuronosyltransferase
MIDISVILCTYNRCASLASALESAAASELPRDWKWEVLIIDNNSGDETREIAERFCTKDPDRFRYIFERRQGKSNALNTGVREARGSILAFMDDDVLVDRLWLRSLTEPLREKQHISGTGGRILSQEVVAAPDWLALDGPYSVGGMLALFDEGEDPKRLNSPPFGTNMAFRREMFERYGGFRADMGPRPGSEIRNEDTEFGRRLLSRDECLWYVPKAVVYHAVPKERLRQSYLLRFWYDHGRTRIRELGLGRPILGIPRRHFRILRTSAVFLPSSAFRWLITRDPKARFFHKGWTWMLAGEISESLSNYFSHSRRNLEPGAAAQPDMTNRS